MGEVLDRIMEASRKGRIDGWDKIERLLKETAELSIRDMEAMLGDKIADDGRIITGYFLSEEHGLGLKQDIMEAVRLKEILCFTDEAKVMIEDKDFFEEQMGLVDYDLCRRDPGWYTDMDLILHMFQEGQKTDPLFRQFWCIGLEDLMDGLNTLDLVRYPAEEREGGYCDDGENEYYCYCIDLSSELEAARDAEEADCTCEHEGMYRMEEEEEYDCAETDCTYDCEEFCRMGEEEEEYDCAEEPDRACDYKSLYRVKEEEKEKKKFYVDLKRDFYRRAKDLWIDLEHNITIGETLEQARRIIWERWCPSIPIYDFFARILTGYEIVNFLLIESFRFWDPEHFDIDVILEKYKKLSEEE